MFIVVVQDPVQVDWAACVLCIHSSRLRLRMAFSSSEPLLELELTAAAESNRAMPIMAVLSSMPCTWADMSRPTRVVGVP